MDNKRIVIKVGTSTLTHENGTLNFRRLEKLCMVLCDLHNQGHEIALVSSGAIGVGVSHLSLKERPKDIKEKQAAAAVGQCQLMSIYDSFFKQYGQLIAQILLTKEVIDDPVRKQNAINTISTLFAYGVIPIVNENDSVSIDEIEAEFRENDTLAAIVGIIIGADLVINLSDIDGLYDSDPRENEKSKFIPVVTEFDSNILNSAGEAGTKRGKGGMATKVTAAMMLRSYKINMVIAAGDDPEILYGILDGTAKCTTFVNN